MEAPYNVVTGNWKDEFGEEVARFYEKTIPWRLARPFSYVAWCKGKTIISVVIFLNYNHFDVEAHLYCPKRLNRSIINAVFTYAFKQCKCIRLTAIPQSKEPVLFSILERLGFTYEGCMYDHYGPGNHGIIFKITPENAARWMK